MKISTIKASPSHYSGMLPHCHGAEKTLISCFSPEPVVTACYYLLVECTNSTEHVMNSTQTPVITLSNKPLPTDMSGAESSTEDGGVPIAVVTGVIGANGGDYYWTYIAGGCVDCDSFTEKQRLQK